jgi:hypothetical protein
VQLLKLKRTPNRDKFIIVAAAHALYNTDRLSSKIL